MKTIDDVVREYTDGVNSKVKGFVEYEGECSYIVAYEAGSPLDIGQIFDIYPKICTIEEYEQHLAAKHNTWYDYDKQQ